MGETATPKREKEAGRFYHIMFVKMYKKEKETSAFILMPHRLQDNPALKPKHLLVYAAIRAHMNGKTRCAFPSHDRIAKMLGMDRATVSNAVKKLLERGAMTATETTRRTAKGHALTVYHFPPEKRGEQFEPVSKALLLNKQLPWEVKAYIVAALRYMFKQPDGCGIMRISVGQIAALLHISPSAVNAYHERLTQLGLYIYDHDDRLFPLAAMGQDVQFEARKEATEKERMLERENEELRQQISQLLRKTADQQASIDHIERLMAGVKGIPNRQLAQHLLKKELSKRQRAADTPDFIMTT